MHITNCHAFDFRSLEFRDERFDHALVERLQDLARQIDALRHGGEAALDAPSDLDSDASDWEGVSDSETEDDYRGGAL
ncbi:MAG: hypothetical protein QGH07_10800, partial [Alphaproteobacteria bacterium]|nr:hypothetical protein [Alphaproteobacteria bacterium]